jgi:hypothetical protein
MRLNVHRRTALSLDEIGVPAAIDRSQARPISTFRIMSPNNGKRANILGFVDWK